jgi:hypothetical protein
MLADAAPVLVLREGELPQDLAGTSGLGNCMAHAL